MSGPSQALGGGRRALVRLSAAVAAGDGSRLEEALADAARAADPVEVEEALLQSCLFVGYPAAMAALAGWRRVSGLPARGASEEDPGTWPVRGERVFERVYGSQAGALRENVRLLHPDLERWMVHEGYGRVLGRPGLPLTERELCIVAVLVVSNAPTQLYSHLRGALAVGVEPSAVEAALEEAASYARPEAAAEARRTWAELRARRGRT